MRSLQPSITRAALPYGVSIRSATPTMRRQLGRLAPQHLESAAEQAPTVEREHRRAHVQRHLARRVAQPRLRARKPPVEGKGVGVEVAAQVADLGRERGLPLLHLRRHAC